MDDILIIGNDIGMLSTIKAWLSRHFSIKDLGEASYILGIRIYRDKSKRMLGLSQSRYIETIVKQVWHGKFQRANMNMIPYASAIGSIMYVMLCTRPDIAHALSVMSRYLADPGFEH